MKTILLFRSSFCRSNLLEHEGVFRYVRERNWRVQTIEYMDAGTKREALGSTILDEIHGRRISTAKERLRMGETIDDVSKRCGYTSIADFRRVFKRYTGISPLKWLKREFA